MDLSNLRERVLSFLAQEDEPVAASYVGQQIDALDMGYADSGDEDVHVCKELDALVSEGLVVGQLYGECPVCQSEHLFTADETAQGTIDCPECSAEMTYDHERPLYSLRDRCGEKAAIVVRPGLRHRVSPLAERLAAQRLAAIS